jgi:hypothetical protein
VMGRSSRRPIRPLVCESSRMRMPDYIEEEVNKVKPDPFLALVTPFGSLSDFQPLLIQPGNVLSLDQHQSIANFKLDRAN